jgi:hypothetical protein
MLLVFWLQNSLQFKLVRKMMWFQLSVADLIVCISRSILPFVTRHLKKLGLVFAKPFFLMNFAHVSISMGFENLCILFFNS